MKIFDRKCLTVIEKMVIYIRNKEIRYATRRKIQQNINRTV